MDNFLHSIKQGCAEPPHDVFDKIINKNVSISPYLRVLGIFGWGGIASDIIKFKDNVSFLDNGLVLCTFCIEILANDPNARIVKLDLELGTECIKSLANIKIDQDTYLSKEEKERVKKWAMVFLDIWKEYIKKEIEKEKKMILM